MAWCVFTERATPGCSLRMRPEKRGEEGGGGGGGRRRRKDRRGREGGGVST